MVDREMFSSIYFDHYANFGCCFSRCFSPKLGRGYRVSLFHTALPTLKIGVGLNPEKHALSPHVEFGRSTSNRLGMSDPLETRPSHTRVTAANLVVLGQTAGA